MAFACNSRKATTHHELENVGFKACLEGSGGQMQLIGPSSDSDPNPARVKPKLDRRRSPLARFSGKLQVLTPKPTAPQFKLCTTCRKPIPFASDYYQCSISTCNRTKTALFFCSVPCWDAHVPVLRHRDAWAESARAPTLEAFTKELEAEREDRGETKEERMSDETETRRRIVAASSSDPMPEDVLIVVSKLKAYIKARGGMNTSDTVTDVLSRHLRALSDRAIAHAAADNRKTVMDRDFEAVLKG
jgi:hypothetical protein